jgi:hypothetical protein
MRPNAGAAGRRLAQRAGSDDQFGQPQACVASESLARTVAGLVHPDIQRGPTCHADGGKMSSFEGPGFILPLRS